HLLIGFVARLLQMLRCYAPFNWVCCSFATNVAVLRTFLMGFVARFATNVAVLRTF
ncbi:MAG: hypothetical protein RL329_2431, partial [Bacteroidota bacterium]